MRDQAAALRARAVTRPAAPGIVPAGREVVVVASGKGGVGKSVLSVLLARARARAGQRVLLFDATLNQGNLHILLGARPALRLESLLAGAAVPRQLLVRVDERLWLLPADTGAESVQALTAVDRARLHHRLSALFADFEHVIVDCGAGVEGPVRAATLGATRLVVVAVPEPAALSDAYAVIKMVSRQVPTLPVHVVVNRVADAGEADAAFERLRLAADRFLQRPISFLGAVPEDPALRRAVCVPAGLMDISLPAVDALALGLPAHA
jgi:flagellar biosynthesis protein FlhG